MQLQLMLEQAACTTSRSPRDWTPNSSVRAAGCYDALRRQRGWPAGCPYVLVNQTFNWPSAAMPRVAVPSQLDSTGAATAAHTLKYVSLCEQFIAHAFASVWARVCPAEPTAKHRTVFVDSGANEGTWSLLAAAYGCFSLAVEPQSTCIG